MSSLLSTTDNNDHANMSIRNVLTENVIKWMKLTFNQKARWEFHFTMVKCSQLTSRLVSVDKNTFQLQFSVFNSSRTEGGFNRWLGRWVKVFLKRIACVAMKTMLGLGGEMVRWLEKQFFVHQQLKFHLKHFKNIFSRSCFTFNPNHSHHSY